MSATMAQQVAHVIGNDEVISSNLISSSKNPECKSIRDFCILYRQYHQYRHKIHSLRCSTLRGSSSARSWSCLYLFREDLNGAEFAALVSVFSTPVAVSSVPIAQERGADTAMAGQLVVWTTPVSALTVFVATFLLKSAGIFGKKDGRKSAASL